MEFTFKSCKFHIGIPFLSLITLLLISDTSGKTTLCLLATLIHELGHITCMMFQQKELRKIQFCLFDIRISDSNRTLRSYKEDVILMFCGPLANFLTSIIFYIINTLLKSEPIKIFVWQNLLLGLFNLLPINSFDGGQIISSILEAKTNQHLSRRILNILSFITLIPLIALGIYVLLISRYNFSLLLLSFYLFIITILNTDKNSRWLRHESSVN